MSLQLTKDYLTVNNTEGAAEHASKLYGTHLQQDYAIELMLLCAH